MLRQGDWDHLELVNVSEHSPLVRAGGIPGISGTSRTIDQGTCPIANLEGGFEAYLKRLSGHTRQWVRRLLREGDRSKAIFELASEATVDQFFSDLVRLHQERWRSQGKPGCFASSRFLEFHQVLARQWVPEGNAVLARLTHEGQPVAVIYGFISGSKFDFYQSGVARVPPHPLSSPGNLANLLLMERLLKQGITRYDFLRGSSLYKDRLSTEQNRLFNLHLWRLTIRTAFYCSSRVVARATRRMMGRIGEAAGTPTGDAPP